MTSWTAYFETDAAVDEEAIASSTLALVMSENFMMECTWRLEACSFPLRLMAYMASRIIDVTALSEVPQYEYRNDIYA